jgi:thioredoxin
MKQIKSICELNSYRFTFDREMEKMSAIKITKENFETEVLQSDKPVLLDFWAAWCGPCKMVSPVIEEIAGEVTHAKVGKVNVDEQPELAAKFRVMSIPTLAVLKGGQVVKTSVGAQPKQAILSMLNI